MLQFPVGMDSNQKSVLFTLAMANRHGLIAGATGTGKTVSLQYLAEQFAEQGICGRQIIRGILGSIFKK